MSAKAAAPVRASVQKARAERREMADAVLGRTSRGEPVEIVTPEGVPVRFRVAAAGDRAAAFVIDTLLIALVLFVVLLLAVVGLGFSGFDSWLGAFTILFVFAVRQFYFAWFESRPRGATPGKRRLGIRVVDAAGGPLSTEAILVRNLTRDVEAWIPLQVLLAPQALWPGAPGWARFVSVLWLLVFALMPLFNRRRMRVGDMVAGTLVVVAPEAQLLADLGRKTASSRGVEAPPPLHAFTDEQLDVYGIYELQVLEEVLRRGRGAAGDREALKTVAERIRTKIAWTPPSGRADPEGFLKDFYAALRARLERRMLLGKRKEDKYA